MDSPLSHLDPSAISRIEVVKGPYALTWGSGNLSAIRVETEALPDPGANVQGGNISTGIDSNVDAREVFGSAFARRGPFSVWGHGAYREGTDYTDGGGNLVPGDFDAWEGRGKLGIDVSTSTRLVFGGGYREQGATDYPGRLLNATYFEAVNTSFTVEHRPQEGPVKSLDFLAYYSNVDHGMTNAGKPTALADPDRMPPFPLDVRVESGIKVIGGRTSLVMDMNGNWEVEIGGDAFFTDRSALRKVFNADTDGTTPMFSDMMWPDAELMNGGAFVRASGRIGHADVSGTFRGDFIKANANSLSDFFKENVSTAEEIAENTASGAITVGFDVTPNWIVSLGAGSVVRPADASERYSDRIPASKAQMTAEFVGDPNLETERSNQADLWIEAHFPRFHGHVNGFARRIQNYITLVPTDPALPRRLPLSPTTVFQYVNGEADFWGIEASGSYAVTPAVTASLDGSYLWGEDTFLDEPALGITPLNARGTLRYDDPEGRFYLEGAVAAFAEQTRVSTTRGESPTEEYVIGDLRAGFSLYRGVNVRGGVLNVADKFYVNHLNAKNPFTGARIAEAGRILFVDLSYAF